MDRSDIARQLADMRPVKTIACAFCGKEATGRGRKTYCSAECTKRHGTEHT